MLFMKLAHGVYALCEVGPLFVKLAHGVYALYEVGPRCYHWSARQVKPNLPCVRVQLLLD